MEYKVLTSSFANYTFTENVIYLDEFFTTKEIESFVDAVESTLLVLQKNPYAFPIYSENCNYRKALIVKQITLFYEVIGNEVFLLFYWNNKKDPKELEKFL